MNAKRFCSPTGPRRRITRRGQALVEFSLVAPLFFFLLFAIIDFGRYVYYVQIINNAAREGARYAIVHGSNGLPPTGPPDEPSGAAVKAVVRNYLVGVITDPSVLDIQPTWPDGQNVREDTVSVLVIYQFHSMLPIVPLPPITVKGTSTLVINN
jgi:Flp pilus assembly protein TadG